ncbi:MAG: hypothetical protein A4E66_02622 [Syntrophus sp. PtaB.Bin001]|nr:MAG: hypothetical protein A4E66_02622 [Syntrophus sp. PtaB.Bin001]
MQLTGRRICRVSRPDGAQLSGEIPLFFASGEDVNVGVGITASYHFEDEVSRRSETRQPQILAIFQLCQPQRPVPYGSGTKERRRFDIGEEFGNRAGKRFRNHHVLGIAAVGIPARRPEGRAEIFPSLSAFTALAAGRINPAYSYPIADFIFRCL